VVTFIVCGFKVHWRIFGGKTGAVVGPLFLLWLWYWFGTGARGSPLDPQVPIPPPLFLVLGVIPNSGVFPRFSFCVLSNFMWVILVFLYFVTFSLNCEKFGDGVFTKLMLWPVVFLFLYLGMWLQVDAIASLVCFLSMMLIHWSIRNLVAGFSETFNKRRSYDSGFVIATGVIILLSFLALGSVWICNCKKCDFK
jgi:hypothetical protein